MPLLSTTRILLKETHLEKVREWELDFNQYRFRINQHLLSAKDQRRFFIELVKRFQTVCADLESQVSVMTRVIK